ncbi:hypothetical protein NIBR502771_15525 [Pseudarthrobacter sp. NIBRBAC000502771]|nr:hypothetical protein NIBR502771_15525 [Pseudarthrobacter sp. NIBRBAC000502771]
MLSTRIWKPRRTLPSVPPGWAPAAPATRAHATTAPQRTSRARTGRRGAGVDAAATAGPAGFRSGGMPAPKRDGRCGPYGQDCDRGRVNGRHGHRHHGSVCRLGGPCHEESGGRPHGGGDHQSNSYSEQNVAGEVVPGRARAVQCGHCRPAHGQHQ